MALRLEIPAAWLHEECIFDNCYHDCGRYLLTHFNVNFRKPSILKLDANENKISNCVENILKKCNRINYGDYFRD